MALPKCSICGRYYTGRGHNAAPVNQGRCCERCNWETVIPARIKAEAEIERIRRDTIEACAQIADGFGGCGMDGKAGAAIRLLAKLPPGNHRDGTTDWRRLLRYKRKPPPCT